MASTPKRRRRRQSLGARALHPQALRLPLACGLAALGAGVAALLAGTPGERVQAANLFGSQPIATGQAIALAQPLAGGRWNLIVLEQLQPAPPCWREFPDGSVVSYDGDVAEGVCGRYLSSSAYSLRVNDNDLSNPWRLRVESENGQLRLLAANPQNSTMIPVASGRVPADGLAALQLAPGWSFQRRTYGDEPLRHLYMANAEPLPVLLARARGGGQLASLPAAPPPPSVTAVARLDSSNRLSGRLDSRGSRDSRTSRSPARPTGVVALEVVPYGS
ncbi:DUF3747 domain-containing protein [Cyanobium sp. NIES-981]|uniref:DUF3747 domain-containing protein n=1 Tax=Cyanobium sp. NIES-981 TaxID=1851505 RepID=UPI0007DDD1E3|nr:DUF3747 domain-containing protein [Cyanobium sp. NIES-981]SBO43764.1 conserved protein of unknown function [Cyanobium sp. NIES-981]